MTSRPEALQAAAQAAYENFAREEGLTLPWENIEHDVWLSLARDAVKAYEKARSFINIEEKDVGKTILVSGAVRLERTASSIFGSTYAVHRSNGMPDEPVYDHSPPPVATDEQRALLDG